MFYVQKFGVIFDLIPSRWWYWFDLVHLHCFQLFFCSLSWNISLHGL